MESTEKKHAGNAVKAQSTCQEILDFGGLSFLLLAG